VRALNDQRSKRERSDPRDDPLVRGRKRIAVEITRRDPRVVGDLKVTHLARPQLASIEQKEHVLFRVTMVSYVEDPGDLDLDAAFLAAFANQRLLRRLPLLELTARKLPQPG